MSTKIILTKKVDDNTILTLEHLHDNTYRISAINGEWKLGKGAFYSDFTPIGQPDINGSSIIITKAEMKRLGTYKLYLNGIDFAVALFSTWTDNARRDIIFSTENDIYYYFRRPDCGIRQDYRVDGSHYGTTFHLKLDAEKVEAK